MIKSIFVFSMSYLLFFSLYFIKIIIHFLFFYILPLLVCYISFYYSSNGYQMHHLILFFFYKSVFLSITIQKKGIRTIYLPSVFMLLLFILIQCMLKFYTTPVFFLSQHLFRFIHMLLFPSIFYSCCISVFHLE